MHLHLGGEVRTLQRRLHRALGADRILVLLREQRRRPALALLRMVERVVGPVEQRVRGAARTGIEREAARASWRDLRLAELDRRVQRRADPAAECGRLVRRGGGVDQHAELVAAQARDRHAVRGEGSETAPGLLQHPVSGGVAEGVVDRLEAVEIEDRESEGRVGAGRGGDQRIEALEEVAPVGQPGQAIGMRQALVLLAETLRFGLRRQELEKGQEVVGEDAHHHHRDEGRVERDRDEDAVSAGEAVDQEDADDDDGHEKGRDRQVHQAEDAGDDGDRDEDRDMTLLERTAERVEAQRPAYEEDREQDGEKAGRTQAVEGLRCGHRLGPQMPPMDGTHRTQTDHRGRKSDRQPRRCEPEMGEREGQGIDGQQRVERRDLLLQLSELTDARFGIRATRDNPAQEFSAHVKGCHFRLTKRRSASTSCVRPLSGAILNGGFS